MFLGKICGSVMIFNKDAFRGDCKIGKEKRPGLIPTYLYPPSRAGDSPSWRRKKLSIYYTDSNGSKVSQENGVNRWELVFGSVSRGLIQSYP